MPWVLARVELCRDPTLDAFSKEQQTTLWWDLDWRHRHRLAYEVDPNYDDRGGVFTGPQLRVVGLPGG